MYTPSFTISSKAVNIIAEISALIERYDISIELNENLMLRKANRIKTIHSSLAIEGNNLSESEVIDIVNGKEVVAPLKEIQEVKNAISTYNLYETLNPFSIDDLLKAHGVMMQTLSPDAGRFRRGGVGVFEGENLIHMAPPADRVPYLIKELFEWLNYSDDHILIKSCVFHYEFEFIHPFSDGNGRIGRLWQSLILGKLHSLFEYLPIENMIYKNQQTYYDAIAKSSAINDSGVFIDFMLQEILNSLKNRYNTKSETKEIEEKILDIISSDIYITAKKISEQLLISQRQVERVISDLKIRGVIERVGARKNGYWKIIK
ncbi:MAG: Fic family protein [Bacteroidales bacterium]|nr:Fic family protein [Bacteroidales bacterium]